MSSNDKRMLDREALRSVIQQWNANRLDLFELSEPNENLEFHGVMRFYFQDTGQKVATKCIRVASDATVSDVIKTLIEKFRPDMRMLSVPNYAIYEVHSSGEERKLNPDEKPLLVQLNWHVDDREGRFLLRNLDAPNVEPAEAVQFKRKLSKREKKEQKKKEKRAKLHGDDENHVAEKLYTELPETSFTRSISNPEAVMKRRRQQKLEKKLQQFRSKDGGPDTGGTLKIYGESLCRDVPYKTLLLSIRDCAQAVVREMLAKYGMDKADPLHYCLVQVNSDGSEYILDDDECPLSILMNHPTSRGSIMFHVRRRPAEAQPRRRKKKPLGLSNGGSLSGTDREGPTLVEVTHSGDGGRRVKLTSEPLEVGSANTNSLQIFGPSMQARHCLISLHEGVCTVTPLHADAITFVNGHHITQPTVLHNGSVVMFGRGASYRFVDPPADGRYNLALSQSQLDSAYLYESRSPTTPTWHEDELTSQTSMTRATSSYLDTNGGGTGGGGGSNSVTSASHILDNNSKSGSDHIHSALHHHSHHLNLNPNGSTIASNSNNNSTAVAAAHSNNNNDTDSIIMSANNNDKLSEMDGHHVETDAKSISSNKSAGSTQDRMMQQRTAQTTGSEAILPAVLEFPENYQDAFLENVITVLDVNGPNFKLAPVYTLYLCARYRASTHYRTDLSPPERAQKLTEFLRTAAELIYNVVAEQQTDRKILSFWIANASEFLHFLKSDRHISAFSVQAQDVLRESVEIAFSNLTAIFHDELSQTLSQFLSENIDHDSAARLVLSVLGSAMALLRQCRVNAALTIQLFSQLFHYISVVCFNKFVTTSHMCTSAWGRALSERLALIEIWAQDQGLELAAESHLSKINQCAHFLQAAKTTQAEISKIVHECFRINSLQTEALLSQETIPRSLIDSAYSLACAVNDEITRRDGRRVTLEESAHLPLPLLIPDDGFSCDVVRGIPAELVDFIAPLEVAGMCRLAPQPTSIGLWTVYTHQFNARSPSAMSARVPQPEISTIQLHKNANGMGLSIVAAKGAGQEKLGIYIKSVVPGGAADIDGRLQAGDQLLRVDGQNLIGITQERAADFLVRTGKVVTLEVAKQGAIYHGLATLLQRPSPISQRAGRRTNTDFESMSRGMSTGAMGGGGSELSKPPLPNSKSVPALHHGSSTIPHPSANKSRSINNLIGNSMMGGIGGNGSISNFNLNSVSATAAAAAATTASTSSDQGFYQNLSVYRAQNQSQQGERAQLPHHSPQGQAQQQQQQNRPSSSSYYTPMTAGQHSITPSGAYALNPTGPQMQPTFSHPNLAQAVQQQLRNKNNAFIRESQGQHSMRGMMQNQMLAPSMPNIAHSSGYAANIQASQSMQNVNVLNGGGAYGMQQQQQQLAQQQQQQQQQHYVERPPMDLRQAQQSFAPRGSSMKGAEMINEMMSRRSHPAHSSMEQIPYQHGSPQKPSYQQQQQQQGSYNRTMSPLRQLPPTAPKPPRQMNNTIPPDEVHSPPLPPTSTHPLYKQTNFNYVASTNEPPKVALYPSSQPINSKHIAAASANPWEREEREKEQEVRREHIRLWRDQQIVDLSSLPSRTQQQEEQLKTLLLERDFERRALEEQAEEDNEALFQKDSVEVVRLSSQKPKNEVRTGSAVTTSLDSPKTAASPVPPATAANNINNNNSNGAQQPKSILKHNPTSNPASPSKQKTTFDPKSHNLTEITMNNTNANQMMSALSKNMTHLNLDEPEAEEIMMQPPPPPERNSSYIIMAQQAAKLKSMTVAALNNNNLAKTGYTSSYSAAVANAKNNNVLNSNNAIIINNISSSSNNNVNSSQISPTGNYTEINFSGASTSQTANYSTSAFSKQDNKRVSFHDEENNVINSPTSSTASGSDNGGVTGIGQAELAIIREDPNKFIDETQAMLQSPTTPETIGEQWNLQIQSTPGVIGAQEVYRDPRTRRLAEQQKKDLQNATDAVPEKLSFKEKMKMFALETGEGQTPKDKLKISRAQRDIDAVH